MYVNLPDMSQLYICICVYDNVYNCMYDMSNSIV